MSLVPIECGGEASDAGEADGGLVVTGGDGAPLLKARPQPFDDVAVVVDPVRRGDRCLVPLGRDRRTRPRGPDVVAEGDRGHSASG